jgi:hypothetical protein
VCDGHSEVVYFAAGVDWSVGAMPFLMGLEAHQGDAQRRRTIRIAAMIEAITA